MARAFALLLGLAAAPEAHAEPAPALERKAADRSIANGEPPKARPILQNKMSMGKTVAWTHDDRFLVVSDPALGIGVDVWEVETGRFVNRIDFPSMDGGRIELLNLAVDGNYALSADVEIAFDGSDRCKTARLTISLARASKWDVTAAEGLSPCAGPKATGTDRNSYEGETVRSHNGRYRVKGNRVFLPLQLEDSEGKLIRLLEGSRGWELVGAGASPDGSQLAVLLTDKNGVTRNLSVVIFDLSRLRAITTFEVSGQYGEYWKILWINSNKLLLPGNPTRVIDAFDGKEVEKPIPFRCGTLLVPRIGLVGSGPGNCTLDDADGEGLELFHPVAGWTKFGPRFRDRIRGFGLTPDGRTLVTVSTRDIRSRKNSATGSAGPERLGISLRAIDAATGRLLNQAEFPETVAKERSFPGAIKMEADSTSVTLVVGTNIYRWDTTSSRPILLGSKAELPMVRFSDTVRLSSGPRIETWRPFDDEVDPILDEGIVRGGRLRWTVTSEAIEMWRPRAQDLGVDTEVLRTYLLSPRINFTIASDGRYDTNLPPDVEVFNWQVSDALLQLLGPQTFMRNLYEPQLSERLIACQSAGDCATKFPAVVDVGKLNRVLPGVKIIAVKPGAEPNRVEVEIEVRGGSMLDAPNGRTTTEPYNLRLFRDGALVAQYPKLGVDEDLSEIETWRERNLVTLDTDGKQRVSLPVVLPTGTTTRTIALTAYAFNEDRVKSETARAEYVRPAIASPRPRRAFVVTFGIDDYDDGKLSDLQFAGNDARLLGERLAQIPGYEVRRAIIARDPGSPKPAQITRLTIARVIAILRGVEVEAAKKALRQQGFDASQLEPPTPDDVVILAFSGHGWADKKGGFYLVPADAEWLPDGEPDRGSLISAVQMADRLRDVDAGEMAMIIDACHSAASVDAGGFKPGPMGDAGLGQLAFDKGIRILAATQADDVALEDPLLRQGLLTYALASEGITATGGKADGDGDGRITLDEWLVYATRRMPSLSTDARLGRLTTDATGARGWVSAGAAAAPPEVQDPALFDFTGRSSRVVLKEGVRP